MKVYLPTFFATPLAGIENMPTFASAIERVTPQNKMAR
jgi:hypothetical protein